MTLSVAVIGAGWYGCHIALSLKSLGFDVSLFEQNERPLHEASGNNQFRLHQGFHYPRHYDTRTQSRDGFVRFAERYGTLSRAIPENIYAVPRAESHIDFLTYRLIMTSSGISFTEPNEISVQLENVAGLLLASERVLLTERARDYFKRRLGPSLLLKEPVVSIHRKPHITYVNGVAFDLVIDATWGHHTKVPMSVIYEPTVLLYYETKTFFPAITFVDGPLCSIYPTENPNVYTLSSVPHTPIGKFATAAEARQAKNSVNSEVITQKIKSMEEQVMHYVPTFREHFRYLGPQTSIKTKPVGGYDDRSCYVFREGNIFSVMSGKIDTVFFAVDRILSSLQASTGSDILDFLDEPVPRDLQVPVIQQTIEPITVKRSA
jgi:hypothetical protein